MSNETPTFGLRRKEKIFDEYIGKWVVVTPLGSRDYLVGKLTYVEDNFLVFNPHQGITIDENGKSSYMIKEENAKMSIGPVTIKPTTEKDVRNSCLEYKAQSEQ